MVFMPAWPCRRSSTLCLSVILTIYTFLLVYVFHAPTFKNFKVLFVHNRSMSYRHGLNDIQNSSDHSSYEIYRWETLQTLSLKDTLPSSRYPSVTWDHEALPLFVSKSSNSEITKDALQVHQALLGQHQVLHETLKNKQLFYHASNAYKTAEYFRTRLQGQSAELLRKIIHIFDKVLTYNQVDYMIYGGTLIGSYRHHSFVPWDDDIDVLVPLSMRNLLYLSLSNLGPEYILNSDSEFCWKFFSASSYPINGCSWKWPYLDIFFYTENETHIWDISPKYTNNFVYAKTIVFPLRRRPFMDLLLLAPHNSRAVISTNYNLNLCRSGTWIHKWERHGKETTVPCSVLFSKFPFVRHTFVNGGCNETLIKTGQILSYFFNEKVEC